MGNKLLGISHNKEISFKQFEEIFNRYAKDRKVKIEF